MWQFKYHTTHFVMAGFGEYYVSLVFITCCLLCAVATVAVRYSNTAHHKYVPFTHTIHVCILPAFDIWMFNILQLFLGISNDPHSMLLTSEHYCPQKYLIYVTINWICAMYFSGQIKYLNMKSKVYHKRTFLPLQVTPSVCNDYDSN
jgi:hypothetical protein